MGAAATALAVALTIALFRLIGPKRTRLVAQIVAAVIGAAFVIGLQVAAILSYGTLSRIAVRCNRDAMLALRARRRQRRLVAGARRARRLGALAVVLGVGFVLLAAAIALFSRPLRRARDRRRRRRQRRGAPAPRPRALSAALAGARAAAARNGRCCGAIPGWCRRR